MNSAAYILVVTLQALTPQGQILIPMQRDFASRQQCVDQFDLQMQALRRQVRGPIDARFIVYCEQPKGASK